jgi:phosphatidylglycerol:prolipoprotein diacylglycerol transferase
MNGCCFGTPTGSSLGVSFPASCAAGRVFPGVHIHPTQLYASAAALAIFGILLLVDRTKRRERDGFLFGLMFVLYSVDRSLVEQLRYQDAGSYAIENSISITWNQLIAAALFLVGLYFMFRRK